MFLQVMFQFMLAVGAAVKHKGSGTKLAKGLGFAKVHQRVATIFGHGIVEAWRQRDGIYVVKLDWAIRAFLSPDALATVGDHVFIRDDGPATIMHLNAENNMIEVEMEEDKRTALVDPSRIAFGHSSVFVSRDMEEKPDATKNDHRSSLVTFRGIVHAAINDGRLQAIAELQEYPGSISGLGE